jgi:hypothetical protein
MGSTNDLARRPMGSVHFYSTEADRARSWSRLSNTAPNGRDCSRELLHSSRLTRGTIPIAELGEGETTMNSARLAGHGGVMATTVPPATDESPVRNGH